MNFLFSFLVICAKNIGVKRIVEVDNIIFSCSVLQQERKRHHSVPNDDAPRDKVEEGGEYQLNSLPIAMADLDLSDPDSQPPTTRRSQVSESSVSDLDLSLSLSFEKSSATAEALQAVAKAAAARVKHAKESENQSQPICVQTNIPAPEPPTVTTPLQIKVENVDTGETSTTQTSQVNVEVSAVTTATSNISTYALMSPTSPPTMNPLAKVFPSDDSVFESSMSNINNLGDIREEGTGSGAAASHV